VVLATRDSLRLAGVAAASLAFFIPHVAAADPLPVTEQNPLLSGFGVPAPLPTRLNSPGAWSFRATFSWANSAIVQSSTKESLVVDAETKELRLIAQRGLDGGFALRVQLPYRQTSGGSLDGFIDRWHDTFGLPEGARPSLPQDDLRIVYARDGIVELESRSSTEGIGDASVEVGRTLVSGGPTDVSAWLGLKLPTGDADDFTGSGSVDATVALAAQHRIGDRWQLFGQLAGTWLGQSDRLPQQQRDGIVSATAGISARTLGKLLLTVQIDARTAVYDSNDLDFLNDTVVLSVGGSYRFDSDWEIAVGVSEDIEVESAPDVVFLFDIKKTF
jgi:hypothetical protein